MGEDAPDHILLARLGAALARARLERNQTQAELAVEAGVSRATVHRLETGSSTQLGNLIRILRALGLDPDLARLVPNVDGTPLEQLREQRGQPRRRRARSRKGAQDREPWTWGPDA